MDTHALKQSAGGRVLAIAAVAGLAGLGLLIEAMQNSGDSARWSELVFFANGIGALVLLAVLLTNLYGVVRDRRAEVPGAALKLRLLVAFAAIAAAPLLVVFLVAVQFLHRGIESWVDDSIATEMHRSLDLSRAVLDTELRASLARTAQAAARLSALDEPAILRELPGIRRTAGAREMSVFARNYRIVASSGDGSVSGLPALPGEDVLLQLPRTGSYVAVEPDGGDGLQVRTAVLLTEPGLVAGEPMFLQAFFPVESEIGALTASVRRLYTRYNESLFLSEPLESSFTLALAVVLLLALFTALYGALVFSRRLVAPIRSLVAGTRAVATGHFETRVAVDSGDDIGELAQSFNEMATRLEAASDAATRNAAQIERERANLATLLARLTTGVIAVEAGGRLAIANSAAEVILQAELRSATGQSLESIGAREPRLRGFLEHCAVRSRAAAGGWREQVMLPGEGGNRRVLMCSAAPLPGGLAAGAGYVLVFEDITGMMEAQREAAWGEVARRLAHEIRNPLTPIQLSAERVRRRCLPLLPAAEAEILDRATHTIVQQVGALRHMVDAFGDYARSPEVNFAPLDLDALVREVADLYRGPQQAAIELDLAAGPEPVEADVVRLRQLMHNLIRNACEALEDHAGARIVVDTRRRDGFVEIRVTDNGPGIDPDLLDRVFDPYVTSKVRGTGLGLAIARRLVEEHGGSISAENPPGGGACLRVRLPVHQAEGDPRGEGRGRRSTSRRQTA